MKKIDWTDRVQNEEELHRVEEERNILQTIKRRNGYWIGHILGRNCLQKYVIEGKTEERIEVTGRQGKRRRQLLDDLKKKRGDCKLKKETVDLTLCRKCFRKGYETVVRY
jgi:hypothetical protein